MGLTHRAIIELAQPFPEEVEVGSETLARVRVVCYHGCDLTGLPLEIHSVSGEETIGAVRDDYADIGQPRTFALEAPLEPGDHSWTVAVRGESAVRDWGHFAKPLMIRSSVKAHNSSVVVWGIRGPVVSRARFKVRVGVKCDSECSLAGSRVEILDGHGAVVGDDRLGAHPRPGSTGLYVAECEVTAPKTSGHQSWSVSLPEAHLELAEGEASGVFGFVTVEEPDQTIQVEVVERENDAPIDGADVRLGCYRSVTDQHGIARVALTGGQFDLIVRKRGFETARGKVSPAKESRIRIEMDPVPVMNPDDDVAWM